MAASGIDLAVILAPADLVYFTGLDLASQLVVAASGEALHLVQINQERARSGNAIAEVRPSLGTRTLVEAVLELTRDGTAVGLPFDVLPRVQYSLLEERLGHRTLVDVSNLVLELRARKSPAELEVLRRAASISAVAFARAREVIKPGLAEYEIQLAMEALERGRGADGSMRQRDWRGVLPWGIVCSGEGTAEVSGHWLTPTGYGPSAARPYAAGRRRLERGDLVVIDRGVVLDGYHCDEARTMVVGRADEWQRRHRDALERILAATVATVQPGVTVSSVYRAAAARAAAEGCSEVFMTRAFGGLEYVGHGVGLEIDEPPLIGPRSDEVLREGMVLALEPKLIVPGVGGLTMEETVVVTKSGREVLTGSASDPFEVLT